MRQKMVETGAVDVMIDIRGNFFYTRTVPCQLWFFDRAKERDEKRRDQVLMLDARNIYRKVSRAVYDFSPEQQKNIAAIVWLYRGQGERFLKLVESYLDQAVSRRRGGRRAAGCVRAGAGQAGGLAEPFADQAARTRPAGRDLDGTGRAARPRWRTTSRRSRQRSRRGPRRGQGSARDNAGLNARAQGAAPAGGACRDLTKQIDLAAKLAGRVIDIAVKDLDARESDALAQRRDHPRAQGAGDRARRGGRGAAPGRATS